MELAYNSIVSIDFTNASPGTGSAVFVVNQPPAFYLEQFYQPESTQPSPRFWKPCADWTEGFQGSQVFTHTLTGPAAMLDNIVRNLRARIIAGGMLVKNTMDTGNSMSQYIPKPQAGSDFAANVPYFVKQADAMAQPQPIQPSVASMTSFAADPPVASMPLYGVSGYADDLELDQDHHYAVPISRGARMTSRPSQPPATVPGSGDSYFTSNLFEASGGHGFSQGMFSPSAHEPSLIHLSPYDVSPGEDIFGSLFDDHTVMAGIPSMPQVQYQY